MGFLDAYTEYDPNREDDVPGAASALDRLLATLSGQSVNKKWATAYKKDSTPRLELGEIQKSCAAITTMRKAVASAYQADDLYFAVMSEDPPDK